MSEINDEDNMLGLMLDIRQDIDNFNGCNFCSWFCYLFFINSK